MSHQFLESFVHQAQVITPRYDLNPNLKDSLMGQMLLRLIGRVDCSINRVCVETEKINVIVLQSLIALK